MRYTNSRDMEALVCGFCWINVFNTKRLEEFWNGHSYGFSYSTTWEQITQSARKGCSWCGFFQAVLPSPQTSEWPNAWTATGNLLVMLEKAYLTSDTNPEGLNQCQIDFCSEQVSTDWHIEFDLFVDNPKDPPGPVTAGPLQTDVSSPGAYAQIGHWLDQCTRHKDCAQLSSDAALPSRLIEVAPEDDPAVPRLRGIKGDRGSYLALSYCWGSEQTYVLTSQNVESLIRGLEEQLLPQTIRDAITVTKALGFKYLWVDALCIMQDSNNAAARFDKDQELAEMPNVYSNAMMTIVASCARSVTLGFLHNRPIPTQMIYDVPIRLSPSHFLVAHMKEHCMSDDAQEPLSSRAWTFQEQILSPRSLIYASHTLQWQCRTTRCNLGDSYHAPNPSSAPRLPSPHMLLLEMPPQQGGARLLQLDVPHSILQHWLSMIRCSSLRTSTLPSDKLPAVSGLASSYAPIFGMDYHAGIWARSAVHQLCWRKEPSRAQSLKRRKEYRAPSWSWASVDGPLYFPSFLQIKGESAILPYHSFKITEWLTILKSARVPFGEVTGGKLVVSTTSRNATFQPFSLPTLIFDIARSTSMDQAQTARGDSDVAEDNFTRSVRCIAMYHPDKLKIQQIGGLMLVNLSGKDNLFQRIGIFTADASEFEGCLIEPVTII